MIPNTWGWIDAAIYGTTTSMFILLVYLYLGWLLKNNYKCAWKKWYIVKNTKKNVVKMMVSIATIITITSYIFSDSINFFGILLISITVSTSIVANVYRAYHKNQENISRFKLLILWITLVFPFGLSLYIAGFFINLILTLLTGDVS